MEPQLAGRLARAACLPPRSRATTASACSRWWSRAGCAGQGNSRARWRGNTCAI
ncbi:hypothetical protein ACU4GD_06420 [Cupriavidus basilensis]